ncbi:cytochrome P450 II f2-like protein II [Elysia marginata]|uniref:Cytochrome P450 II f2-like protein II n=1 Tax=Elysia marginata TaxID=1093978 RepID=A0AAV4FF92_9GAST|nr:cytochrome P450 II f2-like protein II [Elysia marginata]
MESVTPGMVEVLTGQLLTLLALTLSVVLLVKYLLTSRHPENIPPFPTKPYFLMGHLPFFKKGARKQLAEWTTSTGEIFSLYFGRKLVVVLNGYTIVHHAYVKHAETLSDRPPSMMASHNGGEDPNKVFDGEDPNKGKLTRFSAWWRRS